MSVEAEVINDLLARLGEDVVGESQPFDEVRVDRTQNEVADADQAWRALVAAAPRAGWLQWQSYQQVFVGALPVPEPAWGSLLAAETVVDGEASLEVRLAGGAWHLIRCAEGAGDARLADTVTLLTHARGELVYRRYWCKATDRPGYLQVCTRLVDVSEGAA